MRICVADFETNNREDDCRVWEWGIADCGETDVTFGDDIDSFMFHVEHIAPCEVYFDNLKFDGAFIMDFLFRHGYEFTENFNVSAGQFTCTIAETGAMFNIRVGLRSKGKRTKIAEFRDSLKIIPMGIAEMADAFGLDIKKIEEPDEWYNMPRPVGYKPSKEDRDYLHNDVVILSLCLCQMLHEGYDKMTIGSNAIDFYKKNSEFYATLAGANGCDEYLRKAFKGGWCYVNPKYQKKEQGDGLVLDVNSMYPWVMRNKLLPYGAPVHYEGKYNLLASDNFPLYIQHIRCEFELKEGHFPTIQLKHTFGFQQGEYLTSSDCEVVDLYLTNVDLALFLEHYDMDNIEYVDGYMFRGKMGMFSEYVDFWYNEKNEAGKAGNKGKRQIAKLFLNNLFGRFSICPKFRNKIPYYEDGVVKYKFSEWKEREPLYIPLGVFITSYARSYIIRCAQALYDRFIYADTDSLHIKGLDVPKDIQIDPEILGAFKVEAIVRRGKYIHSKCYCEEISEDGGKTWLTKTTVAGLPHKFHGQHSYDDFKIGCEYNKLEAKTVKGGVVLVEVKHKIGAA